MSFASTILETLPHLRRFGFILLGSTEKTDALIKTSLQSVIDCDLRTSLPNGAHTCAIDLYRAFVELAAEPMATRYSHELGDEPEYTFLARLSFDERKTFLLRHVERFSTSATAEILQVKVQDVEALEASAARTLELLPTRG